MPEPDFDPLDGLSEDDKQYISGHRAAFERQAKAHSTTVDEDRKKAAEEHMRATQVAAGIVPTAPLAAGATPRPAVTGAVSVMVAIADRGNELAPTTEKFAPDWASMKDIISKYPGTWIVSRHEFSANVPEILGFFGKEGWAKPEGSEKEKFEAIVKNGRVFRTDPE